MSNFDLSKYETVDSRIKKFYIKYKDGRIITEMLNAPGNVSPAVFKAFIYNGDVLLSTGHAFEIAGQGYVNKTCHLENAETSAIGRGLANMGMNGDLRPSREEMEKAQGNAVSLPENIDKEIQAIITAHGCPEEMQGWKSFPSDKKARGLAWMRNHIKA